MADDLNILETYVQHKSGKKWKERWCVLRKPIGIKDTYHLLLYKNHHKTSEKENYPLSSFIGISEVLYIEDIPSNILNILCKKFSILLAFNTAETKNSCQEAFSKYLGQAECFEVQFLQSPSYLKLSPVTKYSIYINQNLVGISTLSSTSGVPSKVLVYWYLNDMRIISKNINVAEYKFQVNKQNGYEEYIIFSYQCETIDFLVKKYRSNHLSAPPLTKISITDNELAAKRLATDDYLSFNFLEKMDIKESINNNPTLIKTIDDNIVKYHNQANCDFVKSKSIKRKSSIVRRSSLCNLTFTNDKINPSYTRIHPSKIMRSISCTLLANNNKENIGFLSGNISTFSEENHNKIMSDDEISNKSRLKVVRPRKNINVEVINPMSPLPFVELSRYDGTSKESNLDLLLQPQTTYINDNIIENLTRSKSPNYCNKIPNDPQYCHNYVINSDMLQQFALDDDYVPAFNNKQSQNYINDFQTNNLNDETNVVKFQKNNLKQEIPSQYMFMGQSHFLTLQPSNSKVSKLKNDYLNVSHLETNVSPTLPTRMRQNHLAFEPLNSLSSSSSASTPMLPVSKPNQHFFKQIFNRLSNSSFSKSRTTSVPLVASDLDNKSPTLIPHVDYVNFPPLPPKQPTRTYVPANSTLDSIFEDDQSNPPPLPIKQFKNLDHITPPPRPSHTVSCAQIQSSNSLHTIVPLGDIKPPLKPDNLSQLNILRNNGIQQNSAQNLSSFARRKPKANLFVDTAKSNLHTKSPQLSSATMTTRRLSDLDITRRPSSADQLKKPQISDANHKSPSLATLKPRYGKEYGCVDRRRRLEDTSSLHLSSHSFASPSQSPKFLFDKIHERKHSSPSSLIGKSYIFNFDDVNYADIDAQSSSQNSSPTMSLQLDSTNKTMYTQINLIATSAIGRVGSKQALQRKNQFGANSKSDKNEPIRTSNINPLQKEHKLQLLNNILQK